MKTTIASTAEEIFAIKPLAVEWKDMCNCDAFGLKVDIGAFLSNLAEMVGKNDADVLLLKHDDAIVGLMGVTVFKSPFGTELIANEHYLFVKQHYSVTGSKRLLNAAVKWAKAKGCTHLMLNASNAASDMHDKVCKFYERMGLSKFETSYIKEI